MAKSKTSTPYKFIRLRGSSSQRKQQAKQVLSLHPNGERGTIKQSGAAKRFFADKANTQVRGTVIRIPAGLN